jgi:hypothetical protein
MSATSPTTPSALQKHATTAIASFFTGAIVFLAQYFFQDRVDKASGAVLQEQMTQLTSQVIELRADIKALRDNYVSKEDFRDHEQRIRALELRGRP